MSSCPQIPQESIRILLLDCQAVVRAGLRLLLEDHFRFTVVAEAANGTDATAAARESQPNIILMSPDSGAENGIHFLPELLGAAKGARVIILAAVNDIELQQRAVMLGALGVVLKDDGPDVLIQAIERVHRGEVWLQSSMIARVLEDLPRAGNSKTQLRGQVKGAALTERERDVIPLIGEGLRNRQIASRLVISEATVRHHLTSIFAKLGVSDRFELLIYAYRNGLIKPSERALSMNHGSTAQVSDGVA